MVKRERLGFGYAVSPPFVKLNMGSAGRLRSDAR